MRLLSPITFMAVAGLLAAPPALAQGSGAVAHTRITVVVPERGPAAGSRWSPAQAENASAFSISSGEPSGRIDRGLCSADLDLGSIGRASVSCIETVEPGPAPGVVLELRADDPAARSAELLEIELHLDAGVVLRLVARGWLREGRDVHRLTIPTAAFERVVAARAVTLSVNGRVHALDAVDREQLRRMVSRPVHHASRD